MQVHGTGEGVGGSVASARAITAFSIHRVHVVVMLVHVQTGRSSNMTRSTPGTKIGDWARPLRSVLYKDRNTGKTRLPRQCEISPGWAVNGMQDQGCGLGFSPPCIWHGFADQAGKVLGCTSRRKHAQCFQTMCHGGSWRSALGLSDLTDEHWARLLKQSRRMVVLLQQADSPCW